MRAHAYFVFLCMALVTAFRQSRQQSEEAERSGEDTSISRYRRQLKAANRDKGSVFERDHYLGHQKLPGAQLRYFAQTQGQIVALLGFGAAAWKTSPRDVFIGWGTSTLARR